MKRALITGGASPLGAAITRNLAAAGHEVVIHANANIEAAERLAASLRAEDCQAASIRFDLTDIAASFAAVEQLCAGRAPQILVHNAGVHDDAPMAGMSEHQWRNVIDVSLNGFFAVTRQLLLPMMATRWGRIIAVSSVSGVTGNRGQANYAAAKAGLIGAVKSLAREVASRGITVNAVAPGIIASPAADKAVDAATIAAAVPMKRAGTPEEVADLIGFLVSPQAAYITAQTISINGGMA